MKIQGNSLSDENSLFIIIKGSIPKFGYETIETFEYKIPQQVSKEKYGEIDVEYGVNPKRWRGWEKFEL